MKLPILAALILTPTLALAAPPVAPPPNPTIQALAQTLQDTEGQLIQARVAAITAQQEVATLREQVAKLTPKPAPKATPKATP